MGSVESEYQCGSTLQDTHLLIAAGVRMSGQRSMYSSWLIKRWVMRLCGSNSPVLNEFVELIGDHVCMAMFTNVVRLCRHPIIRFLWN